MKYFKGIQDLDAAKARYWELSKKYHSDAPTANVEKFREMTEEYRDVQALIRHGRIENAKPPESPAANRRKSETSSRPQTDKSRRASSAQSCIPCTPSIPPSFQDQLASELRRGVLMGVNWMIEEMFAPEPKKRKRKKS